MKYFKITNKQETHHGLHYKTGLNKDPNPFNPIGSCVPGGIYFTDAPNLLRYRNYGIFVREVTIPNNARMVRDPAGTKWRASEVVLGPRKDLRQLKTWEYLIKQGVDLTVSTREVLEFLHTEGKPGVLRYVVKQCIPLLEKYPCLKDTLWSACIFNKDLGTLKLLPKYDPHYYLNDAILYECNLKILKHISSLGAKLGTRKHLLIAIENGDLKLVKYLIDNGATLNRNRLDIWASLEVSTEAVLKYLIRKGLPTHDVDPSILDIFSIAKPYIKKYLTSP